MGTRTGPQTRATGTATSTATTTTGRATATTMAMPMWATTMATTTATTTVRLPSTAWHSLPAAGTAHACLPSRRHLSLICKLLMHSCDHRAVPRRPHPDLQTQDRAMSRAQRCPRRRVRLRRWQRARPGFHLPAAPRERRGRALRHACAHAQQQQRQQRHQGAQRLQRHRTSAQRRQHERCRQRCGPWRAALQDLKACAGRQVFRTFPYCVVICDACLNGMCFKPFWNLLSRSLPNLTCMHGMLKHRMLFAVCEVCYAPCCV